MVLGKVDVRATPDVLTYPLTLMLPPPTSLGLHPKKIYCIGAILRVGNPDWPSLINGFTEELTIEIYTAPAGKKR